MSFARVTIKVVQRNPAERNHQEHNDFQNCNCPLIPEVHIVNAGRWRLVVQVRLLSLVRSPFCASMASVSSLLSCFSHAAAISTNVAPKAAFSVRSS